MGKIVVPTGYMGSGSSAVTDMISEIEGYDADYGKFEYVFMHCPNGVFDLEDKLLIGNNAVRSDEALHSFRNTMKQLFDKKYWWVGHYKEKLSPKFMEYTDEYVDSLITQKMPSYWYWQENADVKMILKLIWRKIISTCSFGHVHIKQPLVYDDMFVSYVKEDEFYAKTKVYLRKLWKELGVTQRNVILDQLFLPFNINRMERYFDENEAVIFVIDRDPRDTFIINKYNYTKRNLPIPYPTDAKEFCKCYRALREMEKEATHPNIHRIHFEDLVYYYDETVECILNALGATKEMHIKKKQKFNPEKSIENTQLFLINEQIKEEVCIMETELAPYLYHFPYERKPDSAKIF